MKRFLTGLLAAVCLLTGCAAGGDAFSDVPEDAACLADVQYACQSGAMQPQSRRHFAPDELLEAGDAALLLTTVYDAQGTSGGADEQKQEPLARAAELGLLLAADPAQPVTRAELAAGLVRALPEEATPPIGTVEDGAIADVGMGEPRAAGIYRLARAGILLPDDEDGDFGPDDPLTRAEAAGIAARALDPTRRIALSLLAPDTWPDLTEQPRADDTFFEHAAILGNSLVDGLHLFSQLKTLHYFAGTGVSVISATMTRSVTLPDGSQVTQLDSLLRGSYDKVYIELGINEIGLEQSYFIQLYGGIIDRIQQAMPGTTIYVMSLLPVTAAKSAEGTFTMARVNAYNQALYELAAEKHCYYLDVCTPLQGEDGYLPASLASDGVHLVPDGYAQWEEIIRTHYAWSGVTFFPPTETAEQPADTPAA